MKITTRSLARASARHPWRVVGIWALTLIVSIFVVATLLASGLTTEMSLQNNPESRRGSDLLEKRLRGPQKFEESLIVRSSTRNIYDPVFRGYIEDILVAVKGLGPDVVASVVTYYETGHPALVSRNGDATIIWLTLAGDEAQAEGGVEKVRQAAASVAAADVFEVYTVGRASVSQDFNTASTRDLKKAEVLDIPVALAILVIVFGAVVAAIIPVGLALLAIIVAVALTAIIGQAFPFTFFVTSMILLMGLAVGIDYSLFIISRFREERTRGLSVVDAISETGGTATRAVFFSGMTVVISLAGMLTIPTTMFRSLAMGSILVVTVSVLISLTLLPALLSILGDRINRVRLPFLQRASSRAGEGRPGGPWDRIAGAVMRRPLLSVSLAAGVLVAAAVPALGLNAGTAGVSLLPDDMQSKQGFLILESEFGGGRVYTGDVVIDGPVGQPSVQAAVQRLKDHLAADADFGAPEFTANGSGDLGVLSVPLVHDPDSDRAVAAVRRLRSEYVVHTFAGVTANVYVTGAASRNVDFYDVTDRYMPVVFAFVLGLGFLLLTIVFRSLVVPAKAVLMNLLSVGAAYGVLVLVAQEGVGADLLGFQQVDAIEAWLPLFLFSVLFGLSMDYHVFLLSRIRERFDQTGDNTEAVAFGLRSTGRLITGAAVIMVAVFAGFAMGDMVPMQQMGLGLSVAVFLDATLVRSILVPASMKLLGRWNWYLPSRLTWLPNVGIESARSGLAYVEDRPR